MKNNAILYLVLPCYNEEEGIKETIFRLTNKMNELIDKKIISNKSKMVFIDDGSKDNSWDIIKKISKNNKYIRAIKFSSNRGHQIAVLAGLHYSTNKCDVTISLDADLQQDINAIERFMKKYYEGNEIVYGVRNSRKTDGFFKKVTSQMFYKLMHLFGCNIITNHADYRLVSNKVLKEFIKYNEDSVFLRGLFPTMGYKNDIVYFDVYDRFAGKSKYTLKKMLKLAKDGITSYSIKPLQMIFSFGMFLAIISIILLLQYIFLKSKIMFIFGIVFLPTSLLLLGMGIIGIYIGQIYTEVKNRPKYLIEETINEE